MEGLELLIPIISANIILVVKEVAKIINRYKRRKNGGLLHDKLDRIEKDIKTLKGYHKND